MDELRPFDLSPLGDGRFELRAFSDDSADPIRVTLDPASGRRLAMAIGEAIACSETPGADTKEFEVPAGERLISVTALPGNGIRLTVTR